MSRRLTRIVMRAAVCHSKGVRTSLCRAIIPPTLLQCGAGEVSQAACAQRCFSLGGCPQALSPCDVALHSLCCRGSLERVVGNSSTSPRTKRQPQSPYVVEMMLSGHSAIGIITLEQQDCQMPLEYLVLVPRAASSEPEPLPAGHQGTLHDSLAQISCV